MAPLNSEMERIYPVTFRLLAGTLPGGPAPASPMDLPEYLAGSADQLKDRAYLADLSRIEQTAYRLRHDDAGPLEISDTLLLNPALDLIPVFWSGLPELVRGADVSPRPSQAHVLVWKLPESGRVRIEEASGHDLLALKVAAEHLDTRMAAAEANVSVGVVDDIVQAAVQKGLLLAPASKIIRPPDFAGAKKAGLPEFVTASVFTLQWHITQVCDLRCKHCYDRSDRNAMGMEAAVAVLDDLYSFCRSRHVCGQVSFTGGNPFLYPHFDAVYRQAADRGFMTAILGNPVSRDRLERISTVRKPEFFQVSLEGLPDHNDEIRGKGHFDRVMAFLDVLRSFGIYSMVMLTLTDANIDQVLPLAERLKGRTDLFTFNRLTQVGEGRMLKPAPKARFEHFLEDCLNAAEKTAIVDLKDNFFNILLERREKALFGGCTGFGCGAAFNFAALLPDGEVHACRKFPSPIGDIRRQHLAEIYEGKAARRYRSGSAACADCRLRPVCGGCMAVTYGSGLDPFKDKDPYCFLSNRETD